MYSPANSNGNNRSGRAAAIICTTLSLLVILISIGVVSASGVAAPSNQPLAQATNVPLPIGSAQVPDAVGTGGPNGSQPAPVATGGTGANSSTDTGGTGGSAAPPANNDTGKSATASAGTNSGSFPWLVVAILAVMVVLIVLAALLMRNRRTALATAGASSGAPYLSGPTVAAASAPSATSTTTVASTSAVAPATATTTLAAAAEAPPRMLTCPNCSTVNEWSENFCHECGQDLRPVRAGIIAAAAPPADIVTDDMPYLETLDRTDEQLEYVLSRKKIAIGTAAGNDIVIDKAFKGYETVSPRHAELRREGDSFTLVDLNSDNGTFVNDARTGENLLSEGDRIKFGSVSFIYRVPETNVPETNSQF